MIKTLHHLSLLSLVIKSIRFFIITFLTFIFSFSFGANIKGYVTDAHTHEPVIGAYVIVKDLSLGAVTGMDGSYEIKNIPIGTHTLGVSQLSYLNIEQQVIVNNEKETVTLHFTLEEDAKQLAELVVTAEGEKESERSTRLAEQKADYVKNIIGAKAIELLPDITVGNILQRVSGVSIVRNSSGDGQYAVIRGMDKRYNYTLVNGIKIPSPDNKNRYVPMDIFPGDLLERLEVIKALTPCMEGDAIGGAMNMVMKSAPPSLTINATIAGGYSNIINSNRPFSGFSTKGIPSQSPEALHGPNYESKPSDFGLHQLQYSNHNAPVNSLMNFSIGNRVLHNKVGVIVAGSYQHIYRGTNSIFYKPDEPSANSVDFPNKFEFQELQIRQFSNEQSRLGVLTKVDYAINQKNKISLFNFYSALDEKQHRNYHNPASPTGDASFDVYDRSKFTQQRIYNSSLRGDHELSAKFKLDWTAVYSIATSNTPAWSDMDVRYHQVDNEIDGKILQPITQRWTNNSDEDKTGYLNLTYKTFKSLEITTGGMARFKTRNNVYTEYKFGNYQPYTSIDKAVLLFIPSSDARPNPHDPNNYTAKENISALYIQAKFKVTENLQILGGVRDEITHQAYHSELDKALAGGIGDIRYSDFLPSLHFKYSLSDRQNLRLTYYKAISRPNYFEFIPTEISGDYYTEAGNPEVKHTTANNVDLRYEFFDKGNDQILAGVFYKQITNPIEYTVKREGTASGYRITPENLGTATNYGFEFLVTKYIRYWGVSANYTYTQSSLTQLKSYKAKINNNITSLPRTQTRPLQGQSNHIANISLIYKHTKAGFDAQLSWVYTGRRINLVSPFYNLDYWQRGFSQLDFSAEKTLAKKFKLFTKITNLLNTPLITEVLYPNFLSADSPGQDSKDRIVTQKEIFHQTFLLGLRYKL